MKVLYSLAAAALLATACGGSGGNQRVSIATQSSSFQGSGSALTPTYDMPDPQRLMAILLAADDEIPDRGDDDCGVVIESLPEPTLSALASALYSAAEDVEGGCEQSVEHPRMYSCHVTFASSHGRATDWAYHLDVDIDHDHTVVIDSAHCDGTP